MEKLTPQEFRRKLAGLFEKEPVTESVKENIKQEAIRFVSILPKVFGSDLDRMTLWERIPSALETASSKVSDNAEKFINECLSHIKANINNESSELLFSIITTLSSRPKDYQEDFISYIRNNGYVITIYAKKRWNEIKDGKVEA